mgnify:CR=1 FL=1|jgi:serine acetyltransferase
MIVGRGIMMLLRYYLLTLPFRSNFFKTLYFNFKVFPFKIAIHLPVRIIGKAKLSGLYKGCVILVDESNIVPFSIVIGCRVFESSSVSYLKFSQGAKLQLCSNITISRGVNLSINKDATMYIGNDVYFNQNLFISCSHKIVIGDHVRVGWYVQIMDSNFHTMYDSEKKLFISPRGEVNVGNYVWIGNHASLSKNAFIPSHSIVSSHSLVNRNYSNVTTTGNLFAGMPAMLKRTGIHRIFDKNTDRMIQSKFQGQLTMSRDLLEESILKSLNENLCD